jgi:hypothetical protein
VRESVGGSDMRAIQRAEQWQCAAGMERQSVEARRGRPGFTIHRAFDGATTCFKALECERHSLTTVLRHERSVGSQ